jgi:hypothetical protein
VKTAGRIGAGVLILVVTFIVGVLIHDYLYERFLQENKGRIKAGMSEAEVISILGEPTGKSMIDQPGSYWCYGSSTWDRWSYGDVYCGSVGFTMTDTKGVESPPR